MKKSQELEFSPGFWMREVREDLLNMTRDRFGMLLGVTESQVYKWEKNKNPMSTSVRYLLFDQIRTHLERQNREWDSLPMKEAWMDWVDDDYKVSRGWFEIEGDWKLPVLVMNKDLGMPASWARNSSKKKNRRSIEDEHAHEKHLRNEVRRKKLKEAKTSEELLAELQEVNQVQSKMLKDVKEVLDSILDVKDSPTFLKEQNNELRVQTDAQNKLIEG